MNEINDYKIKEIFNSPYPTGSDSLRTAIKEHFYINDFKLSAESDSELTFHTLIASPCSSVQWHSHNPLNESHDDHPKYKRYETCHRNAWITVSFTGEDYKKSIDVSQRIETKGKWQRSAVGAGWKPQSKYQFDELALRKHLYIQYHGNHLSFPQELENKISAYNSTQEKERKKLHVGVDY